MSKTKILSIVFFIAAIVIAYFFVDSIAYDIQQEKRIKREEARVIEKLKQIRSGMIAYQRVNGEYTSDWDKLINFIDSGDFYITERSETIIPREYGGDSVVINIDTLGTMPVFDSLYADIENFKLDRLPYKPGSQEKFEIFADKIIKGSVKVDVFEVKDPSPINPKRRKDNNDKALRVGSRSEVTTAGNWE
ncbi:hypothetical protein QYS48_16555 [Marivirga arenosa]|uniref:Uncharacterized protein n=1 Tax=Marivirga arenosa TaxID=3059076 RepID=A0AA49GFD9_9BACT|nr:hypothetical protein [Marivirga sp. ABR2-2]WKK83858.2 hypothetical protein QYS48_16555 [Marivirga sp. ABR2-2]